MKKILIFFLFCLFGCSSQYQIIKIGAIFFEDEQNIEYSFDEAVNRMNSRFFDIKLLQIKHYAVRDDSILLQDLACKLIAEGVSAIFGPSSKASSDIVSLISNRTGIPQILFDLGPEQSTEDRINRQMTINVAPSTSVLSKAYADIINSYAWKGFTIIYQNDEALPRLQDLLQLKRIHSDDVKIRKFEHGDDYRIVWKNVKSDGEKRVVLDCDIDIMEEVIKQAVEFNMTGQFNQLFLTNLDTHSSDIQNVYDSNFKANVTGVQIETNKDILKETPLMPTLTFDAVVLFSNAVRNLIVREEFSEHTQTCQQIENEEGWSVGKSLLMEMKMTSEKNDSFISKNIQFNEWGERVNFNLVIYKPMVYDAISLWSPDGQLHPIGEPLLISSNPSKKPKDYAQSRKVYRVATKEGEPYFMLKKPKENEILTGNNRFEGYAVDLIHQLSIAVGFDYIFDIVDDNSYGNYNPETKEWNGIVGYLIENKADIGICDLTINQARRSVVDFTVPFMQLGISILFYKKVPEEQNLFAFLDPFAFEVWMYMLTSYLIISLVSILMARLSRDEWENPHPCNPNPEELENKWGAANTSWLMIGSLMGQGCDILPRSGPMRLMNGMWWFFALMMLNSYTANLAAFLTSSKMPSEINGINDLADQNKILFGTLKGGSTANFFSESNDTVYRLAWSKMVSTQPTVFTKDNKEGVERVKKNKGTYAFLMETTTLEYSVERSCELVKIGSQIGEKHYGIAVPLGADYRSNLSVAILKLSEKGELYNLKKKWWENKNKSCEDTKDDSDDSGELTINQLGGVFLVLCCGIVFAFILGILEFLWNVQQVALEERITPMEALKSELTFAVKFWIKKKPVRVSVSGSSSLSSCSQKSSAHQSQESINSLEKN